MAGVFEIILAGLVDAREKPALSEMATRLGVALPRRIRPGTAGRMDWLRNRKFPLAVIARVEDELVRSGIDPEGLTWSALDPWLSWYAWALDKTEREAWGAMGPLQELLDWAFATERTLAIPLSLREASAASAAWHQNTGGDAAWDFWAHQVRAWQRQGEVPDPGEVMHRWPDGTTLTRLRTVKQLREEGDVQGHCVKDGRYDRAVLDGQTVILSIRNPEGFPVVTIESHPDSAHRAGLAFKQVKGPKNSAVLSRWGPYVRETWRRVNASWLDAYEAKMAALAASGKLDQLGVEVWRGASGWRLVEVPLEQVAEVASWMEAPPVVSPWEVSHGAERHRVRFLLDSIGAPQMQLGEDQYGDRWDPDDLSGPGGGLPTPEAQDVFLDWYIPALRRGEVGMFSTKKTYASSVPRPMADEDGVYRFAPGVHLPTTSVLTWLHRGHPQFELGALADIPSAILFATEVDQGPMPDTQALVEGLAPHGVPRSPEGMQGKYAQSAEQTKSGVAWRWLQEVQRGFPLGTLRLWALWAEGHFREYLRSDPTRLEREPDLLARLLASGETLAWFFGVEDASSRYSSNYAELWVKVTCFARPEVRAAALARPAGAYGIASQMDGVPREDTLRGVLSDPGWARKYMDHFSHLPLVPMDPRLKEAVARGTKEWSFVGAKREETPEIKRGDSDPNLFYSVTGAGEAALIQEVKRWWRYLLRYPPTRDVAGWSADLKVALDTRHSFFPWAFAARVRQIDKDAFFGMDDVPWMEGPPVSTIWTPDLYPTTAQGKSQRGMARQAALKARVEALPPQVYWPARGVTRGGTSRVFVPSLLSPDGFAPSDALLPYPLPKGFGLETALRTWWERLTPEARRAVRDDLERVREPLVASWPYGESAPSVLAQPMGPNELPLDRVGFVWVGVTPLDAFDMGRTSRAIELSVADLPLLGSFPLPGPRQTVGYVLILPAWVGAFDRFATKAVHEDVRTQRHLR